MKHLFTIVAFVLISTMVSAQSSDRRFALGIHSGFSDWHGEANNKWFNFQDYRAHVGLRGLYYINPWLNAGIDASYGSIGHHIPVTGGFRANMFQSHALLRFKFNNGKWLKEDFIIQPYIFAGPGLAHFAIDGDQLVRPGMEFTANAGLGFDIRATKWLSFNYNWHYAYMGSDSRDGRYEFENDQFMLHSIGAVFSFGGKKDADGDGVSDRKDKCPSTPANVKVDENGCPVDTDGDGVADYQDACPDVAGVASAQGCPDADGDGVADSKDKCPNTKGLTSMDGCPDSDGDGVIDSKDACPNTKGLASLEGCPDADGDGIIDSKDDCPNVKGLASLNGCPDADGDGVTDAKDNCPTLKGTAANNGCPEVSKETKEVFEQALKGIKFETGRDVIKRSSYAILNNVVEIMKANPSYKLDINGHTDSQGNDDKNMALSKKRAESVKRFLTEKGVDASRMAAYGFGETKPKATNDTAAGRAENRRVEFKVRFK